LEPGEKEGAAKAPPLAGAARLIGRSAGMRLVRRLLVMYAQTDLPVLITGESGTGKELAARALHEEGRRASGSFVPENCAAIPRDLFESILFGHVRGAFTGAESNHEGLFRLASGGTLFLDEIGEMPLPLQAKLLRALQEREVRPVGGTRPVPADARVVAATNRDIEDLLSSGRFREDLYYRLKGALIEIPPLRDRPEDIRVLADHFLALASASRGGPPFRLSEDSLGILLRHDWPGNVRELANEIQRAVALADGDVIRPDPIARLLGQRPRQTASTRPALPAERVMIERTLRSCGGCVSAAAVEIGWNRQKLYRRMARLGVARGGGEQG
jgi:DNA-binding NtrC family response regulator